MARERRRLPFILLYGMALACANTEPAPPKQHRGSEDLRGGGGMFESAEDAKLRTDRLAGLEMARTLESLDGVVSARVHLTTPSPSSLTRRVEEKGGAAVVLVRDNPSKPSAVEVQALVAASFPSLSKETIKVFLADARVPAARTVLIGPIEVTERTAGAARVLFGGLLGLCLLASAGLIVAGLKLRKMRRQ